VTEGEAMSEVVYRSVVELTHRDGVERTMALPGGEQIVVGVHSEIAEHYGREPGSFSPHSATLDHLVAAALG
jgi:hypothetical protein